MKLWHLIIDTFYYKRLGLRWRTSWRIARGR